MRQRGRGTNPTRGGVSYARKRNAGNGRVLISPVADEKSLVKLKPDPDRSPVVGGFCKHRERFLEFRRAETYRSADARLTAWPAPQPGKGVTTCASGGPSFAIPR